MGVGAGQRSLECCRRWGRKESDTTEWLNWTEPRCTLNVTILSRDKAIIGSSAVITNGSIVDRKDDISVIASKERVEEVIKEKKEIGIVEQFI